MNALNNVWGETFIKTTNILHFISSPWQKAEQMGNWNYKQIILILQEILTIIISHTACTVWEFIWKANTFNANVKTLSYEIKYKRQKLLTSSVMSMISPIFSSNSSSFWGTYSNRTLHWRFLSSVMKTQQVTLDLAWHAQPITAAYKGYISPSYLKRAQWVMTNAIRKSLYWTWMHTYTLTHKHHTLSLRLFMCPLKRKAVMDRKTVRVMDCTVV